MDIIKKIKVNNILLVATIILIVIFFIMIFIYNNQLHEEAYKQGLKDGSKWALDTTVKMIKNHFGDSSAILKNDTLVVSFDNTLIIK